MLGTGRLRALMASHESDRVELTVSTKNTDKFGEAICAFANDFPNHRRPGYLLVGVNDDGKAAGLTVTDELLRRLGESEAMATLGYVNAFGRGVIRAQDALRKNGSPEADFTFDASHVLATLRRKPGANGRTACTAARTIRICPCPRRT